MNALVQSTEIILFWFTFKNGISLPVNKKKKCPLYNFPSDVADSIFCFINHYKTLFDFFLPLT